MLRVIHKFNLKNHKESIPIRRKKGAIHFIEVWMGKLCEEGPSFYPLVDQLRANWSMQV